MASITFRKSTKYGTEPYAVLTVSGGSQDIDNNRTLISYSLVLYRPSNVSSSANKSYSITINGNTVKSGTYAIGGKGTKTIASGSVYVTHNSDGTKVLSYGGSVEFGITWSGTALGTITNSGAVTLNPLKIPTLVSNLNISTNIKYFADGISQYFVSSTPNSTGVVDTIVLRMGIYSKTLTSGGYFTIPKSWCNEITTTSDNQTATVTLTTTKDGVAVGNTSVDIDIYIPEYIGKPDSPSAYVSSKTELSVTIDLTRPTFKYGATFARWEISSSTGEVEVTGDNTISFTRGTNDNITVVAYIRAVDSRGFMSDMISVPCYVRKNGFCVYENGVWKQATPYVYVDGEYKKMHGAVYNNGWQKHVYRGAEVTYLQDESGNFLTSSSGELLRQ